MTESKSPRLRTVDKVRPPYTLNHFPSEFGLKLGKEIIYVIATKSPPDVSGKGWEQIFANCIGATWKPSNVGLDDVILENCAWSAKTVFRNNPENAKSVRLISGRNSPVYSFGETSFEQEPNYFGEQILSIWNERVSSLRKTYKHLRTVVLIKARTLLTLVVFEFETIRYDPELFYWDWNKNRNLEAFDKVTKTHQFTWQPHGSQFTIIEQIPEESLVVKVKKPIKIDLDTLLNTINYDDTWISVERRKAV